MSSGPSEYNEVYSDSYIEQLMGKVAARNPGEAEFHQAVREVAEAVALVYEKNPDYRKEFVALRESGTETAGDGETPNRAKRKRRTRKR